MKTKDINLRKKFNGQKTAYNYLINISASEAIECGFVDENNEVLPVQKFIDPENNQIIIKLKEPVK